MQLQVQQLGKRYADRWAIRDITLRAGPGLLGLVGPNGAGKSTLMRIIATLVEPTTGSVCWDGLDSRADASAIRQVLGYLPQDFGIYPRLTGRQFLEYLAALKGLPSELARRRTAELVEMVNLERDADRRLAAFSGGMKQRLGIAQALLNDPRLLIVDEPTAGLDPAERVRFRTVLASLTVNRLVMLSTHIISDVEAVADRLVLLREGRVIADVSPETLVARARGQVWTLVTSIGAALDLQARFPTSGLITQAGATTIRLLSQARPQASAQLAEPTLEDAYLLAMSS